MPAFELKPNLYETAERIARLFGYSAGAIRVLTDAYFYEWVPGAEQPTVLLLKAQLYRACHERRTDVAEAMRELAFDLAERGGWREENARLFMPWVETEGFLRDELAVEVYSFCSSAALFRACKPADGRSKWFKGLRILYSFFEMGWARRGTKRLREFFLRESLLRDCVIAVIMAVPAYWAICLFAVGGR